MTAPYAAKRPPLMVVDEVLSALPPMRRVRQELPRRALPDPAVELSRQLDRTCGTRVRPGDRVAVAVGSRGISALPDLVKATVAWLRSAGALPYIVPAMGSHGGGTAHGQEAMLAGLGVDTASVGAPVRSAMDSVEIGHVIAAGALTVPVFTARAALEADLVIPIGRVKPHTDFRGPIESGPTKMLALGLGKTEGAQSLHAVPPQHFSSAIRDAAELVLSRLRVPVAVAVVEDGWHHTALVEAVPGEDLLAREPELLRRASEWMARLPFDELDVLVVNRIGKDISGTGMDPNVTGRFYRPTPSPIHIERIAVLDLTDSTHGNASGIGMADVVTATAAAKVDWTATYANEYAARMIEGARLPLVAQDEAEAVAVCVRTLSLRAPADVRLAWIDNTNELGEFVVSEPVWAQWNAGGTLRSAGGSRRTAPRARTARTVNSRLEVPA